MNKLFFILSFVFPIQLVSSLHNQEIYPFKDNSSLSWSEFEKNFRKNYIHLDVPPFQLIKDEADIELDFGPGAYVHEADEKYNELFSKGLVDCKPPLVIVDTRKITSSALTGYMLLHEIGHHNYDLIIRRQKEKNAQMAHIGVAVALLVVNAAYLYHNCKCVWNRNFTFKKGFKQATLLGLLLFKNELFGGCINNFLVIRADEYFADNFANKHATLEMMQAAEQEFSVEGFIEDYMRQEYPKEKWDIMSPKEQENTRIAVDFVISALYSLLNIIDITAHPSDKIRHALVQQALKNRFD